MKKFIFSTALLFLAVFVNVINAQTEQQPYSFVTMGYAEEPFLYLDADGEFLMEYPKDFESVGYSNSIILNSCEIQYTDNCVQLERTVNGNSCTITMILNQDQCGSISAYQVHYAGVLVDMYWYDQESFFKD